MKKCTKCNQVKELICFGINKTKSDGVNAICKKCHRVVARQHYLDNKSLYIERTKQRVKDLREWLVAYKSILKCTRCDESHPACIEFHHIKDKDLEICDAITHGWSKERILAEIAKCEVICSNCHRKHHWVEKTGAWRWRK